MEKDIHKNEFRQDQESKYSTEILKTHAKLFVDKSKQQQMSYFTNFKQVTP